jgi:hypothetical protein
MKKWDIARIRIYNQLIAQQTFEKPADIVQWLGAVQAQDYVAAKWALGLRLPNTGDEEIEQAFTDGAFLRTHLMRPTWHFVSPVDIRWLLELTAPRVNAVNAYYYRKVELDDTLFRKCNDVLTKVLQGGKQLTRPELAAALQRAGIVTDDALRLTCIMMHAELDGVVCNGAMRGKQFTYALLDEVVPQAGSFDRDKALAELAGRYFTSHGPATLQDFSWWSGLTMTDARAGLEMVRSRFVCEEIDGESYWFSPSVSFTDDLPPMAYLLPNYDEYTVAYKDRDAIFDENHAKDLKNRENLLFNHVIVINGQVVGTWKRTLKKEAVVIAPNFFVSPGEAENRVFVAAANRYGAFLGKPVEILFEEAPKRS